MINRIVISAVLSCAVLLAQTPFPWFIYYDGTYRGATAKTYRTMLGVTEGEGFKRSLLAELPDSCQGGWVRFVPDASTSTGNLPLYLCGEDGRWRPIGFQADGTGFLTVQCPEQGSCLVGPNTALINLAKLKDFLETER